MIPILSIPYFHRHNPNSLQWCHNKRDGVSNHRCLDCLLNCLFRRRSMITSMLRFTGLCAGNSPVTGDNQYWVIVNWTLMNKLHWNFDQNTKLFIHKNAPENIVCEMTATLSRRGWVKVPLLGKHLCGLHHLTLLPTCFKLVSSVYNPQSTCINFKHSMYK